MQVQQLYENDEKQLVELLNCFNLITHDIDFNNQIYVGLQQNNNYAAVGGLELHPPYALMRSVAVRHQDQGKGYAKFICEALTSHAIKNDIHYLYLLTETAEDFFSKIGFIPVKRLTVPALIKNTNQFSSLCPDTAAVMKKQIIP